MNEYRVSMSRSAPIVAGAGLFLIVFITAVLVTFMQPESFASTARVRAHRSPDDAPAGQDPGSIATFVRTECEIIRSELVLRPVIEKLDLNELWGRKYAGMRLKT